MASAASPRSASFPRTDNPLSSEELREMHAYWRAANYLSAGQIYLYKNPLLREPLKLDHIKSRLLGHWGTTPGLNFIYVHLNRLIKKYDLNVIYVTGPGAAQASLPIPTWRGPTPSSILIFRKQKMVCADCSNNFPFRVVFQVTPRQKRPARSMKVENWAIPLPILLVPLSIIQIYWSAAWSATAKQRPAHSQQAGTRTSS